MSQVLKYTLSVSTAFLISLQLTACGSSKPKSIVQEQGRVILPEFKGNELNSFTLLDNDGTKTYEGRLIFWDENAKPTQIKAVNDSVINGRNQKSSALSYARNELLPFRPELIQSKEAYDQASLEYTKAASVGYQDRIIRETITRPTLEKWFSDRLDQLSAETSDNYIAQQRSVIEERWGAYCDAKIWELAVSDLALNTYLSRPSPLAMCEPYYRLENPQSGKKPYFSDEKLCASQLSDQSYFNCLWQEGVFKTAAFRYLETAADESCEGGGLPGSKAKAIKKWLTVGETLNMGDRTKRSFLEYQLIHSPEKQKLAKDIILNGGSITGELGNIAEFRTCRTAFKRRSGPSTHILAAAQIKRLIDIGESDKNTAGVHAITLIPKRVPADEKADFADYDRLTRFVAMFARRHPTTEAYEVSVNDLLFNTPKDGHLPEESLDMGDHGKSQLQSDKDAIIPEDPELADPAFKAIAKIKETYTQPFAEKKKQLENKYQVLQAGYDQRQQGLNRQLEKDRSATVDGIRSVNTPGATVFFSTFDLKLTRKAGVMIVSFAIDDAVFGCAQLIPEGNCSQFSLENGTQGESSRSLRQNFVGLNSAIDVSIDRDANKLVLRLPMVDASNVNRFGFAPRPRSQEDLAKADTQPLQRFNDISLNIWTGKSLELEFYGQKIDNQLEIFSGNAYLWDGDRKILTGSFSGDLFDQSLRDMLGP